MAVTRRFNVIEHTLICAVFLAPTGCDDVADPVLAPITPDIRQFSADRAAVQVGELVTFRWRTVGATSVQLLRGDTAVSPQFRGAEADRGSVELRPSRRGTYRIRAVRKTSPGQRTNTLSDVVTVDVAAQTRRPTAVLTVRPVAVAAGDVATVAWSTVGARSVRLEGNGILLDVGTLTTSGEAVVTVSEDTVFRLTAFGKGGTTETVAIAQAIRPPTIESFSVTPTTIARGESALLTWQTSETTAVSITDDSDGAVSTSGHGPDTGSVVVTPSSSGEYRLSATNDVGRAHAAVEIAVLQPPDLLGFDAMPRRVAVGDETTVRWRVHGASQINLYQNGVPVAIDSAGTGTGHANLQVRESAAITLVATGPGGLSDAVTHVDVFKRTSIDAFWATPQGLSVSDGIRLNWRTTAASDVRLHADGQEVARELPERGTMLTYPQGTTAYTLVASGPDGSAEETLDLEFDSDARIRALVVAPNTIIAGDTVELWWQTSDATDWSLASEPGGPIAVDGERWAAGSLSLTPTITTTYVLDVGDGPVNETRSATVRVLHPVTIETFDLSDQVVPLGTSPVVTWTTTDSVNTTLSVNGELRSAEASGQVPLTPFEGPAHITLEAEGIAGPVVEHRFATLEGRAFVTTFAVESSSSSTAIVRWTSLQTTGLVLRKTDLQTGGESNEPLPQDQWQAGQLTVDVPVGGLLVELVAAGADGVEHTRELVLNN